MQTVDLAVREAATRTAIELTKLAAQCPRNGAKQATLRYHAMLLRKLAIKFERIRELEEADA